MYILYGGGVTRALGPQMVLEEGNLPYELRVIDHDKGDHKTPEYLAINPAGFIPALQTPSGQVLHEAAGIMVYLAETHNLTNLMPPVGDPQRGLFFCKLFHQTNDVQPPVRRFFRAAQHSTNSSHIPAIRKSARQAAMTRWAVLDDFLAANGPYHLGNRFSLLDLHMTLWAAYGLETSTVVLDEFPAIRRCFELTAERPKIAPLIAALQTKIAEWDTSS